MSSIRSLCNREQEIVPSTQEDPQARFVKDCRKEVEECGRESVLKDEGLDVTLVFVSST